MINSSRYLIFRVYFSRGNQPEVFCKKGFLESFAKFTGKFPCQSLFFLRPATFLKKRLWHRCFPRNFAKFVRTPSLTEHLRWLLLFLTMPKKYCMWMNSNFTGNQSWNKSKHFHLFLILILKKSGFLILVMNNFYKAIFRSSCLQNVLQVLWKISQYSELKRDSNTGVFV